ncbi:MAG: tripartite tricarboxylate transporter TctB family protein [Betaproteobacteria bacterium]|nr:tripartite tricarboxylate transporter TctB family protein [Betaproteobacteria bacterium]MDH5343338.1 tripartite tricarboxylate transporter TctB family protein [Betaproteobacteria bacterium]
MQSIPNKGDVISGAVLAALGLYIISEARQWNFTGAEGPGPGFFPIWYGVAMVVLSLVLVAASVLRPSVKAKAPVDWTGIGRALTVWAAFAVSIGLLKFIGFLTALALLTLFIVAVMYGKSWKLALTVAVGNAVGFYLVFPLALDLSLPVGPLGF